MFRTAVLGVLAAAVAAPLAAGQPQPFDPRDYQDRVAGPPTEVMVLGTAHLGGTPESWDPAVLDTLIEKLAEFRPEIIATEDRPGTTIHKLWAYRSIFPETAATYGGWAMRIAAAAGIGLDMDMPQAEAAARETLLEWPAEPTPADRRRLAALFGAAGDPGSALVQWLRLPESERIAEDGAAKAFVEQLEAYGERHNETVTLSVPLAVRLGLERLHPADSQDDAAMNPRDAEMFFDEVFPSMSERYRADPMLQDTGDPEKMTDPETTIEEYRKLNSQIINERRSAIEWLGVMEREYPRSVGRQRVASWEVRNMRMAANIREASGRVPGGRILVVVGASHKIWLEAYLGMMSDVEIVSTDTLFEEQ
ncbi:DUF5694 domain-containing protein [Qipengyuania qiaonensis]|uniref:TraB/GumN family protein n=1 Tax=Qipengyuania qiaonensis TaxID=2867240 RepID=A0ABS7J445_9SPHN|nr:hypothetical protein [Qipengyuania qiaonensis]